ncbi:MAG TPA: ATP-binding protein [Candidatus Limnocylindria bacterium]|nr:ATP-binding protein [Candidatus Limnocylindria bacterium]
MRRYGAALLATGAAFGASLLLWPVIDPNAFALLCAAVMVSAWYGGLGPGLLSTGLATYAGAYLLARSLHAAEFGAADAVRLGLFMFAALLISTLNAQRKRAERERELILDRAETERARLEAALHQMPAGVLIVDAATGRLLLRNRGVEEILRRPVPPVLDRYDEFRGFHPDGRPYQDEEWPLARAIRTGEVVAGEEIAVVRGDGAGANLLISAAPIRDREGRIVAGVVTFHDVTERRRIERERAALLAREQAARAAAEAAACRAAFLAEAGSVLVGSLDYETTLASVARLTVPFLADWCIVDMLEPDGALRRIAVAHADPADAELARAGGTCPPDPHGTHPRTRVVRTGRPELFPEVTDDVLASAAASREHLAALRRLGCRSAMIVPLVARGQTLGAMTFVTTASGRSYDREDLTVAEALAHRAALAADNTRLYREAREANRVKDEFLMTLSHELRTPLSAAVVWADMLEKGKVDPTKMPRASQAIARNVASLARMVEDLTDVSRIVAGKLRLKPGPVDLNEVIAAAIVAVRPAAEAKTIQLRSVLHAGPVRVWGDAGRLQQVIWNLLSNAIKFTSEGGHVEIRLELADGRAHIVVNDTGQGIRPDFLPFVFERFRQADGATTRAHGGLGLGLAIVRQLVELHGGTVRAESPGEGQGATFTVSLPIRAVPLHGAEGHERPDTADAPSLAGLRVLVVDDEADARECLTTVLEQCGAVVTTVASAREALGALASLRPDILVSDIAMPGEDGYSLIEKIRVLEARCGGRIPAVALTAYAGPEDRRRALAAGYELYVSKPVTPEELVAAVANLSGPSAV